MAFPAPNILYRIQNVDFGTYLELYDLEEEQVVLRSLKETDLQQWEFVQEPTGNRYQIVAAATKSLNYPLYLSIGSPGSDAAAPRPPAPPTAVFNASASSWKVIKESDGSYALTMPGSDAVHEAFLRVNENGATDTVDKKISNRRTVSRNMRWQIVEYWPTVPKDTYRIRTLNGAALDIDGNATQFSATAWIVEPKGNGKCIITNVASKVYLGWEKGKDGLAKIAATQAPIEWDVRSLGEYTYSITFDYVVDPKTTLKLALSITDEEVILKPRKVAHNQIWFFEAVDALSQGGPPPYTSGSRYPEIAESTYVLRNIGINQNLAFYSGTPWRVSPYTGRQSIGIKYVGSGNTFKIYYPSTNWYIQYSGNAAGVVDGDAKASAWVLERANDPAGGYIYYIVPAADRAEALSGETVTGPGGNQVFKVTTKKIGATNQQWRFELN